MTKKLFFYTILFNLSLIICAIALFSFDLVLHPLSSSRHGYNTQGYRGEKLSNKEGAEFRIAAFGGSTTYGYFVNQDETWPFYLR